METLIKEDIQADCGKLEERLKLLHNELDIKNNQLQEHKNQLSLITERQNHYLQEIELLQSDDKLEINKLQNKIKQLQEEHAHLLEYLNSELLNQNEEYERLQNEYKALLEDVNHDDTLHVGTDESFLEDSLVKKEKETEALLDEVQEKQLFMDDLGRKNRKLSENIYELRLELKQIKENIDCKKQDLVETYDLMNTLQEDLLVSKTERESFRHKSTQISDENSLFSEVNDRRLQLQETLIRLKQNCNEMKDEVSSKQKQMSALRLQSEVLSNLLKNDPTESSEIYETLITTYRDRLSILENSSVECQKIVLEKQQLVEKGLPNNVVEFTDNMIKEKRKKEEKLNEVIGMQFRAQKMMSLQLNEANLKLQEWKKTNEHLWSKILHLENNIQNFKLEINNAVISNKETSTNNNDINKQGENEINEVKKTILKVTEDHNKENSKTVNLIDADFKLEEKKVKFAVDAVESKPTNKHPLRKGGKVLQCKSIHITSVAKKK